MHYITCIYIAPSLQIAAVNKTAKVIGEKHCGKWKTARGSYKYEKFSANEMADEKAQIHGLTGTTESITHNGLHHSRLKTTVIFYKYKFNFFDTCHY